MVVSGWGCTCPRAFGWPTPGRILALLFRLTALLLLGCAVISATPPASAAPVVPRLDVGKLVEPVVRCRPGWRRHSITGKCVRIQSRFSWFG